MNYLKLFICIILFSASHPGTAQRITIHAGRLIDVVNLSVQQEITVVVEGNKIISVEKGYLQADDELIDLKSHTLMPGLMDLHVHIESESGPRRYLEKFTLNKEDIAFRAATFADRTLMAGLQTDR